MLVVIGLLIIYFFVYKITGDGFLAVWLALGFPYINSLIPVYFNVIPLVAIALILIYENQSVRNYIFFFCSLRR